MERITGGHPVMKSSVLEGLKQYPDFNIEELPCLCVNSRVRMMKRGRNNYTIYWADCGSCGRQWLAALSLGVAIDYYIFATSADKDPYQYKVKKKRKPKVLLVPQPEPKKRAMTLKASKEYLRLLNIKMRDLKRQKEELLKRKRKRKR